MTYFILLRAHKKNNFIKRSVDAGREPEQSKSRTPLRGHQYNPLQLEPKRNITCLSNNSPDKKGKKGRPSEMK